VVEGYVVGMFVTKMLDSGPYLRLHSEFEAEKDAFDAKSRDTRRSLHKMDLKLFANRRLQQMLLFWRSQHCSAF
jgi:hypothetical protein